MKKIYKEFSYGKKLIGYDYKGYYIEIEETFTRGIYGNTKKWYHITIDNIHTCFDLLKECKEYIDKYIESKESEEV